MASKEHQELANVIKKVHLDLRIQSRLNGAEKAWHEHVKYEDQLQLYADAMLRLATEHWDKNNMNNSSLCRIQWVIDKCCEYFKNGGLELSIEKEKRLYKKYFGEEGVHDYEQFSSSNNKEEKLFLLDVGSCYNPFKKCDYFTTIPIDLTPATDDVMQCDFLKVDILPDIDISDIKNTCIVLPKCRFDIVVFSLLLEYFPSSKQRWVCCKKAYDLLQPNGVLIILTPDSKHATANSKILKNWRLALADIGFFLVCYEKLKHLHCVVYRKCVNIDVPKYWFSLQTKSDGSLNVADMICIPQDFHEYNIESNNDFEPIVKSDSDNQLTANCFAELPDVGDVS